VSLSGPEPHAPQGDRPAPRQEQSASAVRQEVFHNAYVAEVLQRAKSSGVQGLCVAVHGHRHAIPCYSWGRSNRDPPTHTFSLVSITAKTSASVALQSSLAINSGNAIQPDASIPESAPIQRRWPCSMLSQ
jgi:hypothetical protein